MPVRAVLNAYYAWMVRDLDRKQRKEFDDHLYGFRAENEAADRALANLIEGGGES